MTDSPDLAAEFGRHAHGVTYDQLPPAAVQSAKFSTLDTIGCMLGASGLIDVIPPLVEMARDWGGKEESTVLGFGGKLPALHAAFVNGAMGHGLDFDDHLPEGHHPSVVVLPALLAIAERRGHVSGKELITALAVGQDIFARLRKNVTWKQDWFITPVIGTLASAAASARLLGLGAEGITHAIGIACTQSATTMQTAYGTGGDLRAIYAATAAKAGVLSALMAEAGVRATTTPLEGRAAFLPVYFGEWDRAAMLDQLGVDFQGSSILYKLWPSCGLTHGYIDTGLKLMGGPGRTEEIAKIEVFGGDFARQLSEPAEFRQRPPTSNDAKFSIPYTLATALLRGTVRVGDFSDQRRADPEVHQVAELVEFVDDPKYNWGKELPAGAVRITLRDGTVLDGEATHNETPGAALNPLDWEQLVAKFRDCAAHAAAPLESSRVDTIVGAIQTLEAMDDVTEFLGSLGESTGG
jgi:2-methylcitrate dehydratase PrpD